MRDPAPTERWLSTGGATPDGEYTILCTAEGTENLNLLTVMQHSSGKICACPTANVLAYMVRIVPNEVIPEISDRGPVEARFTDVNGDVCLLQESNLGKLLLFGRQDADSVNDLLPPRPPVMTLNQRLAGELVPYLTHYAYTGTLPEEKMGDLTELLASKDFG